MHPPLDLHQDVEDRGDAARGEMGGRKSQQGWPERPECRAGLGSALDRLASRVESLGTSLGLSFLIWAMGGMRTASHMSLREVRSSLIGVHHDH